MAPVFSVWLLESSGYAETSLADEITSVCASPLCFCLDSFFAGFVHFRPSQMDVRSTFRIVRTRQRFGDNSDCKTSRRPNVVALAGRLFSASLLSWSRFHIWANPFLEPLGSM